MHVNGKVLQASLDKDHASSSKKQLSCMGIMFIWLHQFTCPNVWHIVPVNCFFQVLIKHSSHIDFPALPFPTSPTLNISILLTMSSRLCVIPSHKLCLRGAMLANVGCLQGDNANMASDSESLQTLHSSRQYQQTVNDKLFKPETQMLADSSMQFVSV